MPKQEKRGCEDNPFETSIYSEDLEDLAKSSIETFFSDKKMFCGGAIPQIELFSDLSIKTVLRNQFDDRVFDYIHNHCLTKVPPPADFKRNTVSWSVRYLISLLDDLKKKSLPKDFQPGLLLLFFKFCKGFSIPAPPAFNKV